MTTALTRRHLLAAALATGVAAPLGGTGRGWAAPSGPARLTLPRPTGPHPVGTVPLHLVDRSRPDGDRSRPDPVAGRELMADVWYPAGRDARRHPVAPWMAAAPLRALLEANGLAAVAAPRTAGRLGAPALRAGRRPVILFSHGAAGHRSETTVVVQELASHGYVVVTVDHPYDSYTEFPDGRVAVPADDVPVTPWDHARDIRYVLDRIEDLAAGRNPDAGRRPLPAGLGAALDPRRIGMFGWSKGATATALVMNEDRRVRAGIGLDSPMQSQPPVAALDRPFLLMSAEYTREAEPSVDEFWSQLHGWRRNLSTAGARHGAYCDHQWLIPQWAAVNGMTAEDLAAWIGALDPARAVRIQQAYPLAFFDRHLRHHRGRLLDGPSPAFPEVLFGA